MKRPATLATLATLAKRLAQSGNDAPLPPLPAMRTFRCACIAGKGGIQHSCGCVEGGGTPPVMGPFRVMFLGVVLTTRSRAFID